MHVPVQQTYTLEEYRRLEELPDAKHEWYQGRIYAMAGASPRHADILTNLSGTLFALLKGTACRGRQADMRVRVEATGFHCYPDFVILCGRGEYPHDDPHSLLNPAVIFEVLSPSTEKHDRTFKADHYRRIPSLKRYVLVSQDAMMAEVYTPAEHGWTVETFTSANDLLDLGIESLEIFLGTLYDGLEEPVESSVP